MVKQKIKALLLKLPGVRDFFLMREEFQGRDRKPCGIGEPAAKQYVDLDLAALKERHFKRKELIRALAGADKEYIAAKPDELEDAERLATFMALVSIIIVNRNGADKLRVLMDSFHEKDFYHHFEIIFVDNASADDSVSYMESRAEEFDIKIIRNQTNISYSAANNQGVRESSGQYLLFLNNDTEVTDGWLDELLLAIEKADNPGAVGAKLIYPHIPDGTVNEGKSYCIQHTGISFSPVIWKDTFYYEPYNRDNGLPDDHLDEQLMERAGVTAAVLLIKRDVFEKSGGFDERYNYGYEDVDLCLKLIRSGYRNYYCPASLVFHYEMATRQKAYSEEKEQQWQQNAAVLKEKWEKYLSEKIFAGKLAGSMVFSEEKLRIAIVMDRNSSDTIMQKLPAALEKRGCSVYVINRNNIMTQYKLSPHFDILLSFSNSYDLSRVRDTSPYILKIAWPGTDYEHWCKRKYFGSFDMVLTSDEKAGRYIDLHSGHGSIPVSASGQNADESADSFMDCLSRVTEHRTPENKEKA